MARAQFLSSSVSLSLFMNLYLLLKKKKKLMTLGGEYHPLKSIKQKVKSIKYNIFVYNCATVQSYVWIAL